MDYDRIIAISNDKTVYHHGDKRIKVYSSKENFVCALEEGLNTAKIFANTNLNVPQIYSVSATEKGVELVSAFIEGETLFSSLKQNENNYEAVIEEFVLLHKEINSHSCVLSDSKIAANQSIAQHYSINLCHGKYALENVIKDKNGNLYVIDWGNAFESNKEKDCMITYFLSLYSFGEKIADYYLERYCKINAIQQEKVKSECNFALNYLIKNFKGRKQNFFTTLLNDKNINNN